MSQESNQPNGQVACPEFERRLVLFAADELERGERAEVTQHVEHCSACASELRREQLLLASVTAAERKEPSADLLAACRDSFAEALDTVADANRPSLLARWTEKLYPGRWFALHPALSAVLFVLVGFSVGTLAPRLFHSRSSLAAPVAANGSSTRSPAITAAQIDQVLPTADIAGINWTPVGENEPPQVELQLNAERPMVVQGTVDSSDVKRVLLYVLHNSQQFSPDVRLDSVELLKTRTNDPEVRQALCGAVRGDRNPAVRLKALEALNGSEPQAIVRQTLIDALVQDANPGVRIEAINALRSLAERGAVQPDARLVGVLRERMQKDSNSYIRLQSASMIRELGPREKY
jgi:anti-sigma factor RsiW